MPSRKWHLELRRRGFVLAAAFAVVLGSTAACNSPSTAGSAAPSPSDEWPMYGYGLSRTGFNDRDTGITPASAARLARRWDVLANYGTLVTSEPVVANGLIYWGSWDGFEHATRPDGSLAWKVNLGMSPLPAGCTGGGHSLLGSAAVAPIATAGGMTKTVVFVGGGSATFFALDASTGRVLWQQRLADPPADIWSSPLVFNGSVYTTTAGFGDCPGAQGQVFQLDAATGAIQHTFDLVPKGCIGGGVWGSPAFDASTGTLFVATGNDGQCSKPEPYAVAIVGLRASDLSLVSAWQVPVADRVDDSDFGATPVLFSAPVHGALASLVGVPNKDGVFFAFDESRISKGPVWTVRIARGGISPESGDGSISSAVWDGTALYVGGGSTTTALGEACRGSVRALNPSSGRIMWEVCIHDGAVIGALSGAPGVIALGAGKALLLLASATGRILARDIDTDGGFNVFYGGAAIADGTVYVGNANGTLLAYAPT